MGCPVEENMDTPFIRDAAVAWAGSQQEELAKSMDAPPEVQAGEDSIFEANKIAEAAAESEALIEVKEAVGEVIIENADVEAQAAAFEAAEGAEAEKPADEAAEAEKPADEAAEAEKP